jgi:hypothetical protein
LKRSGPEGQTISRGSRHYANTVVEDFKQAVIATCSIHGASLTGVRWLASEMSAQPRHPQNPDPTISFTDGNPNLQSTRHAGRMRVSEFSALSVTGGLAEQHLGQQLIVFVYTIWETVYRPTLASALGTEAKSIDVPILGDLRLMRNDILHHKGIAKDSGRCVELRWFARGDVIALGPSHVVELEEQVRSLEFTPVQ